MGLNTFQPQGNTILISATTTPSAAFQVSTGAIQGCKVVNVGSSQHIFIAFAATSALAVATLPTSSAPSLGMPQLPTSVERYSIPPQGWASVMTSSGTSNVYFTPGIGQF